MASPDIDAAEQGLLRAIKEGNSGAVELFKGELSRLQSGNEAPRAAAPSTTAGGTPEAVGPGGAFLQGARRGAAMIVGAPARMMAGASDLLGFGGRKVGEALGMVPDPEAGKNGLMPKVNNLIDFIAGEHVPESVGRSAIEGAVTGPLSGAKTAVTLGKAVLSAGAAGGATQAAIEKGMNPLAAIPLGILTGFGAGGVAARIPGVNGLSGAETLAKSKLTEAAAGITPKQFSQGTNNQMLATGYENPLLPSQALDVPAPGMLGLQEALLQSRSTGGAKLRDMSSTQGNRTNTMLEELRNNGGQTPRGDDMLASRVQALAQEEAKSRPQAVNAATKDMFNSSLGTSWKFDLNLGSNVDRGLQKAAVQYRSEPYVVQAIEDARDQLGTLLKGVDVTPAELTNIIGHLKRNVLPNVEKASTSDLNRAKGVVTELLKPLEDLAQRHAPALKQATELQASLRADLPGKFDDVLRTTAAGGGPNNMLNAAAQRPEMVGALGNRDPQVAQELLQRTVNQALDKALAPGKVSGVTSSSAGLTTQQQLANSLEGKALQANVELLFRGAPDPKAAAEGFNRVLEVVGHAGKPTGARMPLNMEMPAMQEAARGGLGSSPQKVNFLGRVFQAGYGQFRDNASVKVLMSPDVMDRLSYISTLPKVKLTPALLAATLPQLFQDKQNGP